MQGSQIAQAVAIRGDRILAVGTDDEIQRLIGPGTKTIDAGRKTLLPGLYDSHVHPLGAAQARRTTHSYFWVARGRDGLHQLIGSKPRRKGPGSLSATPSRPGWRRAAFRPGPSLTARTGHMVLHRGGPAGVVN